MPARRTTDHDEVLVTVTRSGGFVLRRVDQAETSVLFDMLMVLKPETLDTIVATNLHADILSDLASSLGIAATTNLNPVGHFPWMFEPIHGVAFDITGKGIANPIIAFFTARLIRASEGVTAHPALHPPDAGGTATTRIVTDAVIAAIAADNA